MIGITLQPFTCRGEALDRGHVVDTAGLSPSLERALVDQHYLRPATYDEETTYLAARGDGATRGDKARRRSA